MNKKEEFHLFCFSLNLFWLACRKSNVSNTYDDGHDVVDRSLIYNCLSACKTAYNFSPSFSTSTSYPLSILFLFWYFLNFLFSINLLPLSIFFSLSHSFSAFLIILSSSLSLGFYLNISFSITLSDIILYTDLCLSSPLLLFYRYVKAKLCQIFRNAFQIWMK